MRVQMSGKEWDRLCRLCPELACKLELGLARLTNQQLEAWLRRLGIAFDLVP